MHDPQLADGWADNISHRLNLPRRSKFNIMNLFLAILLLLPLVSSAPTPPLAPYHFDTNVTHKGGLLYAQTPN